MYFQPYGDEQQLNLNWIISEIINLHKKLDPDYETPSFTQVYPYSNLNRLNLDWILSELKALKELAPGPAPGPALDIQAIAKALVALPFDSNTSYQIYDFISRDGEIWRATEAIAAGGEWDSSKWFKTKIGTDLAVLERWINTINNSLTTEIQTRQDADTALRNTIDVLTSADISDDSNAGGATVKASLNNLKGSINAVVIVGNNTAFTSANIPSNAILKGTFTLNSEYTMTEKQVLIGEGATIEVSGNGKITMNKYCTIENLNFVGDYNPTRTASGAHLVPITTESNLANQTYITGSKNQGTSNTLITCTAENCVGLKVTGCSFSNIDKMVIFINGGNHTTDTGFIISDNYFNTVWNAVCVYGEFGHINGNTFIRCILGITLSCGVTEKCNNTFKQCDVSLYYIATSGNMAHGTMSGCNICHSGLFSIYIKTISATTGEIIVGCQIAEGGVKAEVANNLLFIGCRLDTWFNIVSGSKNKIANNIIRVAYLDGHDLYAVPSDTIIRDNVPIDTATEALINSKTGVGYENLSRGSGVENGNCQIYFDPVTRLVTIMGYARNTSSNISTDTDIFTIPAEYRPRSNYGVPAVLVAADGATNAWFIRVLASGEVRQSLGNSIRQVQFFGTYPI